VSEVEVHSDIGSKISNYLSLLGLTFDFEQSR